MEEDKNKIDFKTAKILLTKIFNSYLKPYKRQIIFVLAFAILGTVFAIIGPKIMGDITTNIFNGLVSRVNGGSGVVFSAVLSSLIVLFVLYLLSFFCNLIQNFIMNNISEKITYKMRKDLVEKIAKLPIKYFDKKTNGEILSVITNDVDNIETGLNQSVVQTITAITKVVGIIIMMMIINFKMAIASIVIIPLSILVTSYIVKKSQHFYSEQQEYLGKVNGQVEETYSGFQVVKAFNGEKNEAKRFSKTNEKLRKVSWRSQFLSGLINILVTLFTNLGYVVTSILGGYLAIKGEISVGDIQSFIMYNRLILQPIDVMSQIIATTQSILASIKRIFDFLEEEEEAPDTETPITINRIRGNVKFDHVSFAYNEGDYVIKDFSAIVRDGQKVAIVGPTGAGKTTIVKLLMRFYDVTSGGIYIDGVNINRFRKEDLRKMFGMVLQDTWIFNGTLRENIAYAKENATDEEITNASKAANLYHFIQTLPNTFNLEVSDESTNFSFGQKQLITIARVILENPKMLILDEATSNIDTRTEVEIQKAMDLLMRGRTSFVIAHRLSTIKNADLILVMDKGKIVEYGNHEDLLARNGFYANIYNSQFLK